ncbi:PepSY domain-containing protein [Phytohabitans houttuyneae]|uniref:Uncharacterized protein n=1 Tax=Phytohabitans houttuyneae TaxID=1076126 RepID=A0A6V8K6A1_9ACTN|nr:PepSY domain-containing protein [Phytohabitans houttuyneae]GFJ77516.1 hypothetical protein Phou_016960 [Phytohabitans houttuyneae]
MLPSLTLVPAPATDTPHWADILQAYAAWAGVLVGVIAATVTGALLVFEIRRSRKADREAASDRADAAVDRELARQDRDRATAERRDAEMAQARTVLLGQVTMDDTNPELRRVNVAVRNYGVEPVTDVRLEVTGPAGQAEFRIVDGTTVLGGGEALNIDERLPGLVGAMLRDERIRRNLAVTVEFADMRGLRWRRVDNGPPERVLVDEFSPGATALGPACCDREEAST